MKTILRWLASAGALLLVAHLVPGITVDSFTTAILAALVLGLVNGVLGPVLRFFSFPIRLLTLGLFSLVINAALFGLAMYLVPGFDLTGGLGAVFVGAIVYGVLSWLIQGLLGTKKK